MLMRICKCGRRVKQGEKCPCQKSRHKLYDETRRDDSKREFYHSVQWRKIAQTIKARAKGLDEYQLAKGVLEVGSTVHHIYPIEERPDLKTNLSNLIFVSAKTHNQIHAEYSKGEQEKRELQKTLLEVTTTRGQVGKFKPCPQKTAPPFYL